MVDSPIKPTKLAIVGAGAVGSTLAFAAAQRPGTKQAQLIAMLLAPEGATIAEIAEAIQDILEPQGVGVVIEAEHSCMTLRGVNTTGSLLTTSRLLGVIRDDPRTREEFLGMVHGK